MVEVFGVFVNVDLDPMHRAGEFVVLCRVLVTDAGSGIASDV